MAKNLLIVESPSKAKTIGKYLGADYDVIASYGHVRDLSSKNGSVRPDDDFAMDWENSTRGKKQLNAISDLAAKNDTILLATDPDREGEAIAWHIHQALKNKKACKNKPWQRVVFHEITKKAVSEALNKPRDINQDLVDSYMARRALDYLVGYTLSPVLWRKLPGARSAGRVQSAALRLVCEREMEIKRFKPQEYWSIHADISYQDVSIATQLSHIDGKKLDKKAIANEQEALTHKTSISHENFTLNNCVHKEQQRHPTPPFSTSSLQQEASRKLGFSVTKTMQLAQKLYEGVSVNGAVSGLITYMRTDSISISNDAIYAIRDFVSGHISPAYIPDKPRYFKSKAKNTQEAHEAIRPTYITYTPNDLKNSLDNDAWRLYQLIWNRTIASQMASAKMLLTHMMFVDSKNYYTLSAHGHQIKFDGFLKIYREGKDDEDDEVNNVLPTIPLHQPCDSNNVEARQHFTEAPPRFGEASLVKKMEEVGIGRPSTYASTLKLLQDREYLTLDKKRFTPSDKGMLVNGFLTSYYNDYFNYDFTATMEDSLDNVAEGEQQWKELLHRFWQDFHSKTEQSMQLTYDDVRQTLDGFLNDYLFAHHDNSDSDNHRACPSCNNGNLNLQLGRYGPFIGCSNYPECQYRQSLDAQASNGSNDNDEAIQDFPKLLGQNNEGLEVFVKKGPYGFYVELATASTDKKVKPKRASINKATKPDDVTLEQALHMLSLPRIIGMHPDDNNEITAAIGRFGPYLKWSDSFYSIPKDDDIYHIGMNRAVEIIASSGKKNTPVRVIGPHPNGDGDIVVKTGRYGPYIQYKKTNAPIPKTHDADTITLDDALLLLEAKAKKTPAKSKASTKKTAAKKAAAKSKKQ